MMRDASEHVEMGWGALWVGRMATLCISRRPSRYVKISVFELLA